MDEHDLVPARFPSRPIPRQMAEGEATDQLVAGILDWAETTDQDRDDLDRGLRQLVTRRGTLSPAESATAPGSAGRGSLDVHPAVGRVDPSVDCCGSRSELS